MTDKQALEKIVERSPDFSDFSGIYGFSYRPLTTVESERGSAYRVEMPDATSVFEVYPNRTSTLGGTRATMIHVHGDMNFIGSVGLRPEKPAATRVAEERQTVMVGLSACLRVAGVMVLVLVIAGVAANASSAGYVAHPLFLAVMTVSGVFLFLMSFGRPS